MFTMNCGARSNFIGLIIGEYVEVNKSLNKDCQTDIKENQNKSVFSVSS